LGSTVAEVIENITSNHELLKVAVEQKRLDDYFTQIIEHKQILIKIDTEGNELAVLRGATTILQEIKPIIIFECNNSSRRIKLFNFFETQNYKIYNIPWNPIRKSQPLGYNQFIDSSSTNFIAIAI